MINIRNKIIALLHGAIGKPIIPNTNTQNRPEYPFIDYSITSLIGDKSDGYHVFTDEPIPEPDNGDFEIGILGIKEPEPVTNLINTGYYNHNIAFSFNSYSDNETEAYDLIKQVWDWFKHQGVQTLSYEKIAVVDVLDIQNRTILAVDEYEKRYGFDLIIRYAEPIERTDLIIEGYTMDKV